MRKIFPIFCFLGAAGSFLLTLSGAISSARGQACLLLGFTALFCGLDHQFLPKRPNRTPGWTLIWIAVLQEVLLLIQKSLPWLQPVFEKTLTLAFVVWAALFAGIGLLLLPLFGQLSAKPAADTTETTWLGAFLKNWGVDMLILLITVFSLSPLLKSGYYWDDAVNATAYLYEKQDGLPLIQNLLIFMRKYIELGRINILSCYYYFFFMIEQVALYKALIIGLVCANILQFGIVIRKAGTSRRFSRLAMLLIPLFIQFRAYQDPVTGFYGLMQVILAELLLTAYLLLHYLQTEKPKYLILSLLPFAAGLLTYEVCFPFILMIPLLVLAETGSWKKTIRTSIPFGALVLICLGAIAFVRANYVQETTYAGVAFSLNPGRILQTYGYQLFAALPLSFYTAGKQLAIMGTTWLADAILPYTLQAFLKGLTLSDILILGLTTWALALILRKTPAKKPAGKRLTILALGLCLWFLPAVTIAVSERYQGQLLPGLGYLPVYLEYFGVALLILAAVAAILQKLSDTPKTVVAAFAITMLCLTAAINLQNNRKVTALLNREFLDPRKPGEHALQAGLLSFLPQDSTVIFDNPDRYIWEADWNERGLYREYAAIHSPRALQADGIEAVGRAHFLAQQRAQLSILPDRTLSDSENLHILSYDGDALRGLAKFGHVTQLRVHENRASIEETLTDRVLYFVSGEVPETTKITYQMSGGGTVTMPIGESWQVRQTPNGTLYQLPEGTEIFFETLDFYGF